MRALAALVLTFSLVLSVSAPAFAGDPPAAAADKVVGQSIAPADADGAGAETCGNGGACCGACQFRQKYAKPRAEADGGGGCPCQRARRARERAAAEAAAARAK
jgi:hypothetical protein